MAMKFPNVYIGTAAWPAHRWPAAFVDFVKGQGRGKCMLGTSFPTVGHRHALTRLDSIGLDPESRHEYLEGAARRVFTRMA
jgi:predicted TIM-barrel fold metal-dependent hydrolase